MDRKTKPGEKGFTVILLLAGLFVTVESLKMYREDPTLQGYGTVPLICGVLLSLFSLIVLLKDLKTESEIKGLPFKEKASSVIHHLFIVDVVIMLLFIAAYCLMLYFGIPFVISSPIFLWASMSYLRKTGYVKNILFTAIVMAFVIVVFNVAFGVVLP